jgi:penicillin amidase
MTLVRFLFRAGVAVCAVVAVLAGVIWYHPSDRLDWTVRIEVGSAGELEFYRKLPYGTVAFRVHGIAYEEGVSFPSAFDMAFAQGQGFAHCVDRSAQMMLQRAAGQGRLAELVRSSPETLLTDRFLRDARFGRIADDVLPRLSAPVVAFLESYAAGVNACMRTMPRPAEAWFVGAGTGAGGFAAPWTVRDTLLTMLLTAYVGMSTMQLDAEKVLLRAVRDSSWSAIPAPLAHLFGTRGTRPLAADSPQRAALLDVLRSARLVLRGAPVPANLTARPDADPLLPAPATASNNWAIHGSRTRSGAAVVASDPHLEVSRLPAIFVESVGSAASDPTAALAGVSLPGVPGLVMGRSRRVSWCFTYGLVDGMDLHVEEVVDGRARRRHGQWEPVATELETVYEGGAAREHRVHRTSFGTLEADGALEGALPDGLYVARRWAWELLDDGHLRSVFGVTQARTALEAADSLRGSPVPSNFLLGDAAGSIAYQQAGIGWDRTGDGSDGSESGLVPRLAWDTTGWTGLVPPHRFRRVVDPECGFLATANEWDVPPMESGPSPLLSFSAGQYRRDRARQLVGEALAPGAPPVTAESVAPLQLDVMSPQAARYLDFAAAHGGLPEVEALARNGSRAARALLDWDRRYAPESEGAPVWEAARLSLEARVAAGVVGRAAFLHLRSETNIGVLLGSRIDDMVLDPSLEAVLQEAVGAPGAAWEELATRLVREAAAEAVSAADAGRVPATWGQRQTVRMKNLFLGGLLPASLGVDFFGAHPGHSTTLSQGATGRRGGREFTQGPLWRFVTDMAASHSLSALAGGPSGRFTSPFYTSELALFRRGGLKRLEP